MLGSHAHDADLTLIFLYALCALSRTPPGFLNPRTGSFSGGGGSVTLSVTVLNAFHAFMECILRGRDFPLGCQLTTVLITDQ